jgi:hypothetical protein
MTVQTAPRKIGIKVKGSKADPPIEGTVTRAHLALNKKRTKRNIAKSAQVDQTGPRLETSQPRSSRICRLSSSPGKRID